MKIKEKFNSIEELERITDTFDIAEKRKVFIENPNQTEVLPSEQFTLIYNKSKGKPEAIMSKQYQIVQHKEALVPVIMGIRSIGTDVWGFVTNEGSRCYLDLLFKDNKFILNPDGNEVHVGIRFVNSFDGTNALTGKAFAYRSVCDNGMIFGKNDLVNVYRIHRGEMSMALFQNLIGKIAEFGTGLNIAISEATKDYMERESLEIVLNRIGFGKRYTKKVMEEAEKLGQRFNRWELYNVLTDFASHDLIRTKQEIIREQYQEKAYKVLANPIEILTKTKLTKTQNS